ncbi:hypothetical protein [Pectobacterium parmentieri]|uniref:hypothetical protein n=1 Tax=Pectobacterium parmentieri TaxID=1905730 RepID=UPI0011D21517|nr:hypothetical protein [Pectobacterium parmentieri]
MKTDIPKIDGADRMAVPCGTAFFYFHSSVMSFSIAGRLTSFSPGLMINRPIVVSDNCQCSGDLRGTPSGNHMPMPSLT